MTAVSDADLAATGALLRDVFSPEVGDPVYLDWLYRANPEGGVAQENLDDDQGRAGHYAVVPWAVRIPERHEPVAAALSLNTAVLERARGGGVFTTLAEATYAQAAARGIRAIVGVANANSTPGFERRLHFHMLGSLPALVVAPTRAGRAVESETAGGSVLADDAFWRVVEPLLDRPVQGLARAWDRDTLAWRLASPRGPYRAHLASGAAALSTGARVGGMPVAVVLKLLPAPDTTSATVRALIAAACRSHKAPVAIHVGGSTGPLPRGLPLPVRLRPSPLNLIFRWLGADSDAPPPRPAAWEFLDFDAY